MGQCTSVIEGKVPNISLFCLMAVANELGRRQEWLLKKIDEMTQERSDAITKAKNYLKDKELMLALASAKVALMENQKISSLDPVKEKLQKAIGDLQVEIKNEQAKPMSVDRFKAQLSKQPIEMFKELVKKWISEFEDMIQGPSSSIGFLDELEKDIKSNPLELFNKLKEITELGDFDESVIDIAFNPQMQALNVARKIIADKNTSVDAEIREYRSQKDKCLNDAKSNAKSGNYVNSLMLVKTLPILEAKLKCGEVVKKGLDRELQEMDSELSNMKSTKPSINELKAMFSQDQATVMTETIQKWIKKQQEIVADLATSPADMMKSDRKSVV